MKNKKLIQILLPLKDQKGVRFPQAYFTKIKMEFTNKFGGITAYSRTPASGLWKKNNDKIEQDTIITYEVIANTLDKSYWKKIQKRLEKQFNQEVIIIRSIDINIL